MSKSYKIEEDSLHDKFQKSRAKVQMFAGGFGNGKTTAAVVKALKLAKEYPGSNGLVARSTYPKLTSTIRKEFRSWAPKSWVARDIDSKQNLMELTNGSIINFSHIQQTGKSTESSTSNLLSATYDWIVIDQIEDPEITQKDFEDLLGRLRGQTPYAGDDETMPSSGPRWLIIMCNPTRNWVYRKLVKPYQDFKIGIVNPELLMDDETGEPIIEIFEGSTYENAANLPADFIKTLEASYKGQMRTRFLNGGWEAYEGLIYPEYNPQVHLINHDLLVEYYNQLVRFGGAYDNVLEAYDHGIAKPACYGFAFTDFVGNVFVLDGFYEKEMSIANISREINKTRREYGYASGTEASNFVSAEDLRILADPSIFRRVSGNSQTVGVTTSGMFREHGIKMIRGNNDVLNGIAKVQSYLYIDDYHKHPILTDETDRPIVGAPRLYVSKKLNWFDTEIVDYYWKKDQQNEYEDIPMDRNDHAMDMVKYLLSRRPRVATARVNHVHKVIPDAYRRWREAPEQTMRSKAHRHG
jgi:phage terminase large subunit